MVVFFLITIGVKFNILPPLKENTEINLDKNFVVYYKTKDDVITDIEVIPYHEFKSSLFIYSFKVVHQEILETQTSSQDGGLVPTIEIPFELPTPITKVIGEGGKLDISGQQEISFGGSKTHKPNLPQMEGVKESWFPELTMEQRLVVNLKGTIGKKIHVSIDHDSEREFELHNRIKLEYKGEEDEIIQSIKAGNTDLSLPNVKLIGSGISHQGLFGIKAESKIGPIDLVTILSREQAETQEKEWCGGGLQDVEMKIDDIDYVRARFFYIVPPKYVQSLQNVDDLFSGDGKLLAKKILEFEVYLDEKKSRGTESVNAMYGEGFDIPNKFYTIQDSFHIEEGRFIEKDMGPQEFFLLDTSKIGTSYRVSVLELSYSLPPEDLLAIKWKYVDWYGDTITVGSKVNDTLKGLQILKRKKEGGKDTSYVSWWYEAKNIYSIGGANVKDVEIRIFKYNRGGGEDEEIFGNTTYREFLGIVGRDGRVLRKLIDTLSGVFCFPSRYPFVVTKEGEDVSKYGMEPDSIYKIPKVTGYNVTPKYYILVKYRGVKTTYELGMNIIENSEKVILNGKKELVKGKDYNIDYSTGVLTFLTDAANDTSARIKVTFQYAPLFQPKAKNLIGTRMYSKIGKEGEISSAFIYYSTKSYQFRPTLEDVSRKILLGEMVGKGGVSCFWLTKLVNSLPLIATEKESKISFHGNVGFSLPTPSVKGYVYLDDMEGVKSSSSLGIMRRSWSFGSPPLKEGIMKDTSKFAQVRWHNLEQDLPLSKLYTNLPEHRKDETVRVLRLSLPKEDKWRYPEGEEYYWVSIQNCISDRGMDFSYDEAIEVWVKGEEGILYIDIGTNIPEDAIRRDGYGIIKGLNEKIDTEDSKNVNGKLDEEEDVGLDGVKGEDGSGISGDDGNDDYDYSTPGNYSKINGTEENDRLDTEDLDGNLILNKNRDYFRFKIDLKNSPPTSTGEEGWKFFKLPLNKPYDTIGSPQWEYIKYVRIWVEEVKKGTQIEFAKLEIVGNRWKHVGRKEKIKIGALNTEENKEYYPPPEVEREKDFTGVLEKEQSLTIRYENLNQEEEGGCYLSYTTRPKNLMLYKGVSLWIRGEGEGKFYIRMGGDKGNYYEYKVPIPSAWQKISFTVEKFTQLKTKKKITDTVIVEGSYKVRGNPSFTNIGRIEIGVVNETSTPISGEVWVNDIKLTHPRRDIGVASMVGGNVTLADVAEFSFSLKYGNPYFQSLNKFATPTQQVFTSNSTKNFNISGTWRLNKFMPPGWRMNLPLTVGFSENTSYPLYEKNSDVLLSEERVKQQTSYSKGRRVSLSIRKERSNNRLLNYTLESINIGVNYRDGYSNSFTQIDSSQNYSAKISYTISPNLPVIKIKQKKLKYYPEEITLSSSYGYGLQKRYKLYTQIDTISPDSFVVNSFYQCVTTQPPSRVWSKDGSIKFSPFQKLSFNYSITLSNDLNLIGKKLRYDPVFKRYATEVSRQERVGVNFSPNLKIISPSLSYTANYNEDENEQLNLNRNVSQQNEATVTLSNLEVKKLFSLFLSSFEKPSPEDTVKSLPPGVNFFISFFKNLSDPTFTFSLSRSSSFYSLRYAPYFPYKWGIRMEPAVCKPQDPSKTTFTRNYRYGIRNIGGNINNVTIGTAILWGRREMVMKGAKNISTYKTYPQLNVGIRKLERFFNLNKWLSSLTGNISYEININESGTEKEITSTTKGETYTLGVNTQWKRGVSLGVTTNFNKRRRKSKEGEYLTTSKSVNLTSSYTFRAPEGINFPFFRRIKWEGGLDFSLSSRLSSDKEENLTAKSVNRDTKTFTLNPSVSYNFSTTVTGGLQFDYAQSWYKNKTYNSRTVGVKVFAVFKF